MSEIPGLGDEIDDIPKPSAESVATTRRLAARASTVRAIGLIFLVNAAQTLPNTALSLAFPEEMNRALAQAQTKAIAAELMLVFVVATALFTVLLYSCLGLGLRALRGWARWLVVAFGLVGVVSVLASFGTMSTVGTPAEMAVVVVVMSFMTLFAVVLALPSTSPVFTPAYRSFDARNRRARPGISGREKVVMGLYLAALADGFILRGVKIYRGL